MRVNVVGRVLLASVEIRAANKKFKKHVKAIGLTNKIVQNYHASLSI